MKSINSLLLSAGLVLASNFLFAQSIPGSISYSEQALMFSNYNYAGSARIKGLGNTQISLGGDISSALSNPAGLGFYNRSELSITPSFNSKSTKSNYLSSTTNSTTGKFNIGNFGAVFNKTKDDAIPGKWRGGSFAISISKINDFNNEIEYSGMNSNNDIIDYYVQDANNQNVDSDQLGGITYGAYNTYLMSEFLDANVSGNDTTYIPFYDRTFFTEFPQDGFPTNQSEIISSEGSQNQWSFSYGGNYGDVLYFGATLGIQSLRYNIVKQYSEIYPGASGDIVDNSVLVEDLLTEGFGVNGTFGIIGRPIDQMTIGVSLITPTHLSVNEKYYYSSAVSYNNFNMNNYGNYFDANYDLIVNPNAAFTTFREDNTTLNDRFYEEESLFDYTLTTPLRINGGATFFINKNGFITADAEFVDYSNIKLKGKQGSLQSDNEAIKNAYKSIVNLRVGGEYRLNTFRLRAGYNYQPSPYLSEDIDMKTQTYSAGLGYRSGKFFMDFVAAYEQYNTRYSPYTLENPNNEEFLKTSFVEMENSKLNFSITAGLFF